LWPLLLPGGRLLYVTCSLLPLENVQQLDAFLTQHADAEAVELPAIPGMRSGRGVQLLPGIDHTDGFFYAAVEKRVTI
ncbi:MAG: 16S rRNA (cytosine(967)-C(5))-methyltransferase RsmB, partial [Sedimenticolaceae bacterium]